MMVTVTLVTITNLPRFFEFKGKALIFCILSAAADRQASLRVKKNRILISKQGNLLAKEPSCKASGRRAPRRRKKNKSSAAEDRPQRIRNYSFASWREKN
jgi:type II secretory pathway component PulC